MRPLLLSTIAFVFLSGCAAVSSRVDDLTGTTLAERCDFRRDILKKYDYAAQFGLSIPITAQVAAGYRVWVGLWCPEEEEVVDG